MPLVILLLGLAGLAVYGFQRNWFQVGRQPTEQDLLDAKVQQSISETTQRVVGGSQLSEIRARELQKWQAIAGLAGTTSATAIAGFTSLSLTAAGPIGAAIAGIIVVFGALRGTAHKVATIWVNEVQNPFDRVLISVLDGNAMAMGNGSATRQSVSLAKQTILNLWYQYQNVAEQFAAQSKDHREVIDNSYCWYVAKNCRKGPNAQYPQGFLNHALNGLDRDYSRLTV